MGSRKTREALMLRTTIAAGILLISSVAASAQIYTPPTYGAPTYGVNPQDHQVQGYTNHNGTYVAPHYQTNPNGTQYDNFSTRGNVNPYTGNIGTRIPRY